MGVLSTLVSLLPTGSPKTYTNPPKEYWTLGDLKLSASTDIGLERHLESFSVEGKIRSNDIDVVYRIEHELRYKLGWVLHVIADTSEVRDQVEKIVKSIVGGSNAPVPGNYLSPQGNPSTSEILGSVEAYRKKLGPININQIRFSKVPKSTYKKAVSAKLKLQKLQEVA